MSPRCAVVGLGTVDRGDDAVGPVVADRLAASGVHAVPVAVPLDLLEVFDGYDTVVVVDATRSGRAPGTVTVTVGPLASQGSASTHGLGLAEAVELARVLDRLPARLVVVGVEVESAETGTPLSPAVAGAVDAAVAQVRACLAVPHGGA